MDRNRWARSTGKGAAPSRFFVFGGDLRAILGGVTARCRSVIKWRPSWKTGRLGTDCFAGAMGVLGVRPALSGGLGNAKRTPWSSARVDDWYLETMPIQGSPTVTHGPEDFILLNAKLSAVLNPARNDLLCQVSSEDIGTSSTAQLSPDPAAVIDRDVSLVCIPTAGSAGNLTIRKPPRPRLDEVNASPSPRRKASPRGRVTGLLRAEREEPDQ
jgi:hypothetical protein